MRRRASHAALVLLLTAPSLSADGLDAAGVKAALIFNFLQFVEWPQPRLPGGAPLQICVVGPHEIVDRLQAATKEKVKGHTLTVVQQDVRRDLSTCHVIFVPATAAESFAPVAKRYSATGALVIGDDADTSIPAVLNLRSLDKKVAFEIDLDAADAQQLDVSSRLISLASRVIGSPRRH